MNIYLEGNRFDSVTRLPSIPEIPSRKEEVLARVVNQTIIKDTNFEETNHVTIFQSPHPDYPPATTPIARRGVQNEFSNDALEETLNFLADPTYTELTVITRSMNAAPLMHSRDKIWGLIKTNEENKPAAADVIGGCGPDETIPEIIDHEGFSEETVMFHKKTGKFLLPLNGHDMSVSAQHLKQNAQFHLEHNGYVPEQLSEALKQLISSSNDHLIEPIPHNTTSETIGNWLNTNLIKATVILENIKGEQAEPVEGYYRVHREGSDLIIPFHVPPPEELAVVDVEWVVNDLGVMFATQRDHIILPTHDWEKLALSQPVEEATIMSRGRVYKQPLNLPLKSLAQSLFAPRAQRFH